MDSSFNGCQVCAGFVFSGRFFGKFSCVSRATRTGSLAKQLMDGQKSVKELESALATLKMRSKRIKQSIDKNSRELAKSNADKNRYDKEVGRHEQNLNKLRVELQVCLD